MLTYEQIKELINSIDSSSLRVFELEEQGFKLKLSKNKEVLKENIEVNTLSNEVNTSSSSYENNNVLKDNNLEVNNNSNESLKDKNYYNSVKSPLVGTYYSCGTPGGKPYVQIGDKVKKGDVLCIVEAMKIMNEITSEYDGEITDVLRRDEDIVEFGMELFRIK